MNASKGGQGFRDRILHWVDALENGDLDFAMVQEEFGLLSAQERPLARELVSGILRWKGRMDLILDALAHQKKPSGFVRKALYQGLYPLLAQEGAPVGTIVRDVVEWVKIQKGEQPARFVNAILRKVSDQRAEWVGLDWDDFKKKKVEEQARYLSVSPSLWKAIREARGEDWGRAFCLQGLERPETWVRTLAGPKRWEGSMEALKEQFQHGDSFVQDLSSQALVTEVGQWIANEKWPNRVVDLCASPGGKSVGLAWDGIDVMATDIKSKRLARLQDTVARVGKGRVRVVPYEEVDSEVEEFAPSVLWIDAPCGGSGTLRRHPELKWNRGELEWRDLEAIQSKLLRESAKKIGSRTEWKSIQAMVYSVCSVLDREGKGQVATFLKAHPDWKLAREFLFPRSFGFNHDSGRAFGASDHGLGASNNTGSGDGFYAAFLRRSL